MNLRSAIPNLITVSNLICGTLSIYFAATGRLKIAAILILAGAFLDLFDGLTARLLKVSGELGKQLDSLADVVTFGVAPAFIALALNGVFYLPLPWGASTLIAFLPVLIPGFSAYRLAKFNIDLRQTDAFIGLPTPAAALFWVSIPLSLPEDVEAANFAESLAAGFASSPLLVGVAALAIGVLMVSEIPLMSLKFKSFSFRDNLRRYTLLILGALSFVFFGFASIPIILLLYFLLSISKKNHVVQS